MAEPAVPRQLMTFPPVGFHDFCAASNDPPVETVQLLITFARRRRDASYPCNDVIVISVISEIAARVGPIKVSVTLRSTAVGRV